MPVKQLDKAWFAARLGLPTASKASLLVTSAAAPSKSMSDYADALAADLFAGQPIDDFQGNVYTERGTELESIARAEYAFEHTKDEVTEVGFIRDEHGRFGASPDGLVGDDGLVEIKCCGVKAHLNALFYWYEKGKPPPTYMPQIAMQLLATDRAWCDLFHWHPSLPSVAMRVDRSIKMDVALLAQIDACIEQRDARLAVLHILDGSKKMEAAA